MTPPPGDRIDVTDAPDPAERARIAAALLAFNDTFLGPAGGRPLAVRLREPATGTVIGGIWGRTAHRWLFIELVFVPTDRRRHGLGARLLAAAEAEATARGCLGVWLDTFNPAARAFYEAQGYRVFGEIADYPPGHRRCFLRKCLDQP